MSDTSRFGKIEVGMSFDEVKKIFGEDIWQHQGFSNDTWLVRNERDNSGNRGYIISFDENMKVKDKGYFSCS